MRNFRIALAQINPTVGDLEGNATKVVRNIAKAREAGAELVAFPELAIPGYPPEDLLLKPQFLEENRKYMEWVVSQSEGIAVVVGFADAVGAEVYNAAAVAFDGQLIDVYHKMFLPNYGVFDEDRYFRSGGTCPVYCDQWRFGWRQYL